MKSIVLFFILLLGQLTLYAQEVGDRIILKATNALGVPVHENFQGHNDYYRLADGSEAKVAAVKEGWYKITHSGGEGWIIAKYIASFEVNNEDSSTTSNPWSTPQACQMTLDQGKRFQKPAEHLRIGTWNIRWYPYGCSSGENCPESATDNTWLAGLITWMGLDVLAMQEVVFTPDAKTHLDKLVERLNQISGGQWEYNFHQCGSSRGQHVGFLYNTRAVSLDGFADIGVLNGAYSGGSACAGNLRPGRYAYVKSKSADGVDFHMISVHFDSGKKSTDFANRERSIDALETLFQNVALEANPDGDLVVLGDYNTMGCSTNPELSATDEIEILRQEIARSGYRYIPSLPECSEYYQGHGGILDHIVCSYSMTEGNAQSLVLGYCKDYNCQDISGDMPLAYQRLSDHCPIIWDILDKDQD